MNRFLIFITAIFLLVSSQTVQAADIKPYFGTGVGVSSLKMSAAGPAGTGSQRGNAFAGFGILGFNLSDLGGCELRFGGTSKASITIGSMNYDTSVDWFLSYLAKLKIPLSDQFKAYTLVGATTSKHTYIINTPGYVWNATGTTKDSHTSTNATFGIGLDYRASSQWHIAAEVMRYDSDFYAATANLSYAF